MASSPSLVTMKPPRRYIYNDQDMDHFLKSPCKRELLSLTSAMGKACASADFEYDPLRPLRGLCPATAALHGALRQMLTWMDDIPPLENMKARFGNPAFKKWNARLVERAVSISYCLLKVYRKHADTPPDAFEESLLQMASQEGYDAAATQLELQSIVDAEERDVVQELSAYLHLAFGHPIRLDYGTGHESCFQVYLFCLCKLGCFGSTNDVPPSPVRLKAATVSLYSIYLQVCRQIQTDYMLEPAGTHGVWGLDDYHCLPFYFGACQLQAVDPDLELTPKTIHNDQVLQREGDTYLYFGCIRYIKFLKKGAPFFETSPMLNDISNLPNWSKVASGLLLLYEGEVLKKRQVVQHFVFGHIFAANWIPSVEEEKTAPRENFPESTARLVPRDPLPSSTQAPWASQSRQQHPTTATQAPWSSGSGQSRQLPADFSPTKAPWAK